MAKEEIEDVFNLDKSEASSYLEKKKQNDDGLLRPKLEEGKDGERELTIRFLPNLMKNGKIGPTAVEKHIHYADFKQNPELVGYFDCLKNTNIGKECPLCKAFWALKNSKNPADEAKAKLISRSTKYYSYVYVVEDTQKQENEGKIFIFPFGFKIYQKIKAMAENKRKPVKVEDLVFGANLVLKISEVGGFYNYDASYFEGPEPISIGGSQLKVDADGTVDPKHKAKVIEFLKSREHDLEEHSPKDWTDEQRIKADKIIGLLSGNYTPSASDVTIDGKKDNKKPLTSAQIFDTDDSDDEDESASTKKETAKKPVKETKAESKEESSDNLAKAKKKASAFFEEDEEQA